MQITSSDLIAVFSKIFKQEIDFDLDVPLMESGVRLDSLRIIRLLIEIENLLQIPLPQEDAFELFGLSINQLVTRLNVISLATN
jgi:acyl carrier protein